MVVKTHIGRAPTPYLSRGVSSPRVAVDAVRRQLTRRRAGGIHEAARGGQAERAGHCLGGDVARRSQPAVAVHAETGDAVVAAVGREEQDCRRA